MIMENRHLSSGSALRRSPEEVATSGKESPLITHDRAQRIEEEISRLTWAVMDGWATQEDRLKLAELVDVQYQLASKPR